MPFKKFSTVITRSAGKTRIILPFDPNEAWGVKGRHYVTGSINGVKYRGPVGIEGDTIFVPIFKSWLRDSGIEPGQKVDVLLDAEGPQLETLPADVASALNVEPQAREFFLSLATFYRKGYLRWIDGASRRPEIRRQRIQEMIDLLKAGKKQRVP